MFDFGFWELVVVLVVALLVVGPERLPQVARTAGLWIGRLRRMADGMREEIRRELEAEELKKSLQDLKDESGFDELERELHATDGEVRDGLESARRAADAPQRYEILEGEPAEDGGGAGVAAGEAQAAPRAGAEGAPRPADAAPEPAAQPAGAPEPAPAHPAAHRDGTHDGKA